MTDRHEEVPRREDLAQQKELLEKELSELRVQREICEREIAKAEEEVRARQAKHSEVCAREGRLRLSLGELKRLLDGVGE